MTEHCTHKTTPRADSDGFFITNVKLVKTVHLSVFFKIFHLVKVKNLNIFLDKDSLDLC